MANWQTHYPPYEGEAPYLYFAFADADRDRVWPLIRRLLRRGCRIWYAAGPAGSAEELLQRQRRALGAELTLLYASEAARRDTETKGAVLVNQREGRPILVLDADRGDSVLAFGLREDIPHLAAFSSTRAEDLEAALIRTEGFTQAVIGQPIAVRDLGLVGRLARGLCVLAAAMLLVMVLGTTVFTWFQSKGESLPFSDPVIRQAAESALGGTVTAEKAGAITTLTLDRLPDSWEDLSLLPAVERVRLPQTAVMEADALPSGVIIVLTGGEAP
ncbi:MAG: hypothetical protein J5927_05340 [Oscillospiraceae bacterium]|nr:hypothetical protein [Oscillospiraceae bacterium]